MTDVMINALYKAKKLDSSIVTCLIVPDLPQFMNLSSKPSLTYKIFKIIDIKLQKSKLKYIDKFVLLTEKMSDKLNIRSYTVVEGIGVDFYANVEHTAVKDKTVMYAGSLNKRYGIINLIDAFMKIEDPDYRLILCGAGDSEDYIREAQKKDSRIDFKGLLPRKEILSLQISSSVLINPRQNIEEFTKYSFPSKTIEYMLSARPVIMYKLDGVPDEYDNYLNYVPDNSVDSLKQKIVEICSLPVDERNRMGQAARKFVLNEKNSEKQVKKIIDLCE
jgi:glycosyltransferase involved in cell wall biosynthesis